MKGKRASTPRRGVGCWLLATSAVAATGLLLVPSASNGRAVPRLDLHLRAIARVAVGQGAPAALDDARASGLDVRSGGVRVIAEATGSRDAAASAVRSAGGIVEVVYGALVQARVEPGALERLGGDAAIASVSIPARPEPAAIAGEGVALVDADDWQRAGIDGAGAKVAVIDLGFAGYAERQATGDLPAGLTTVDYCADGFTTTPHGTGVAEIVHEVAPRAELTLICANTIPELGLAAEYVRTQGIRIVNYSVLWFNTSRGDGSGGPQTPDGIVADLAARGVLWVSAAGNQAQRHWLGVFRDADGDRVHEFGPTSLERNGFDVRPGGLGCAYLKWDSWPSSRDDFDLSLRLADGTLLWASTNDQDGTGAPPVESACYRNPGPAPLRLTVDVTRSAGTGLPRFDLFTTTGVLDVSVPEGSIVEPASSPHALAVGAQCWQSGTVEPYSSRGPTIAGLTKPDLVGPDSVSSASYGAFSACGTTGFTGTSAAAPHAAGAAALWAGLVPGATGHDLRLRLLGTAVDAGDPGADTTYGQGRLRLPTTPATPDLPVGGTSTASSITVAGTVDPNGLPTEALAEYGLTSASGSRTAAVPAGAGLDPVATAPITLSGLRPATDYRVRLVARNRFGEVVGAERVFSTNGPPVVVGGVGVPAIGGNAARVVGVVNARGLPTTAWVEIGPTTAYGLRSTPVPSGALPTAVEVPALVGGLEPSTTYHVRFVAENAAGTAVSPDAVLRTGSGEAPVASTGAAKAIAATSAVVEALVDTRATTGTQVRVEYGPTSAYGSLSAPVTAPFSTTPVPVDVALSGLSPSTTVHYRVVAANRFGTTVGGDAALTTAAPPPSAGGGSGAEAPDLAVAVAADRATARVGDALLYRVDVRLDNAARTSGATSVVVTSALPEGVTLVSTKVNRGPGCTGARVLICPLDFLAGALVGVVEIVVRVEREGDLVLSATAAAAEPDPDTSDNSARVLVAAPPRAPTAAVPAAGVTRRGTRGADVLRGTPRADRLFGLAGNDRLYGLAGDDRLEGGPGADLLAGGAGRDVLDAGAGADRVLARDGAADRVRCGPGRDVAVVDRRDRTARDCEIVRRPRGRG